MLLLRWVMDPNGGALIFSISQRLIGVPLFSQEESMFGIAIATLFLTILGPVVIIAALAVMWFAMRQAIYRQDDRISHRRARQAKDEDEDNIGSIARLIRKPEDTDGDEDLREQLSDVLARYPDAKLPEEL